MDSNVDICYTGLKILYTIRAVDYIWVNLRDGTGSTDPVTE